MITIKILWFVLIIIFSVVIGDLVILWFVSRNGSDYIYTEKEMERQRKATEVWKKAYARRKEFSEVTKKRHDEIVNGYEKTIRLLKESYENKLKKVN